MNDCLNAAFDGNKGEVCSSFLLEAGDRGKRQRNGGEYKLDTCQRQVSPFLRSFFFFFLDEEKLSETLYQARPKKINKPSVPLDNGPILPDRGRWELWGKPGKHPLPISFHLCSAPAKHHSPHTPRGLSFIEAGFKPETATYPVRSLKAGWSYSESESLLTTMALE